MAAMGSGGGGRRHIFTEEMTWHDEEEEQLGADPEHEAGVELALVQPPLER